MRSRNAILVITILFSTLFLSGAIGNLATHSSAVSLASGYTLTNSQTFNQYGQFLVNETLVGSSNSTAMSSVVFGFPSTFQGHVVSMSSQARMGSSTILTSTTTSVSNNTLLVSMNFGQNLAGPNSSATLSFWVLNAFTNFNSSGYFLAPILYSPYVSIQVNSMVNQITLPYSTTNIQNTTLMGIKGYSQTVSGTTQTFNFTTSKPNSTLNTFNVLVFSNPTDSGSVDFNSVTRQIIVDSSGQVMVKDTIVLHNLGLNEISALSYAPLSLTANITAVPSREPPLSNVQTVTLSGGQLSLNSTNQAIQPQSLATLIYEYQLSSSDWTVTNGVYTVSIPENLPVGGIVDQYQLFSSTVPGIHVIGKQLMVTMTNANASVGGTAVLKFRVGIASATSQALPIAAIMFGVVFVAGAVFRPRSESTEDVGSTFDSMIRTIEDKVSSTNDLLSDLRSKESSIGRNELATARSRIDDVRTKTNSRLSTLRSQLPQTITTSVQAGLNELLAYDRDFDRLVRDILSAHDQFATKRMKEDTFERAQQNNSRKLQNITNSLIDRAHDLREEYESEK